MAMPLRMAPWMPWPESGLLSTAMEPPVLGSAPNTACISSLLPEPCSPVRARISPRRTLRDTS